MSRATARVLAVVQARMSSSRLPGKVLEDLGGTPVLVRVLDRLREAQELQGTVLATSVDPSDDPVAAAGIDHGTPVVRGPLDDVLERYRLAAERHPCDAVVRITADCPLLDPRIVDLVVRTWRETGVDYVSNTLGQRTYPKGLDVEVMTAAALETAAREASDPYDREHVTPFIRTRANRFSQRGLYNDPPYGDVRVTLDTAEDLRLLREIVDRAGPAPSMERILAVLEASPDDAPVSDPARRERR